MKRCPTCKKWYPADPEWFYRNKARPDGLMGECKNCDDTRKKKNHQAKRRARMRAHSKAKTRLAHAMPELFEVILNDELRKAGLK